ncbi:hypothetical protein D0T84_00975 [Dysgonomonas sp. 521]|uniref:hypothetical protein n=1 Tax=Dysgonomonas sp. 521 TaxID=2302932 RepID=UPI0013D8BCFC|nr:hypothetical protein [Dysgonomonas sp. 521]NDV93491.1 hypothetical protein [Dysgonomonas sp. 521]
MEKQLQLEDIAGYLPYELKARKNGIDFIGKVDYWDGNGYKNEEISITNKEVGYFLLGIQELRPILRPMSDLYESCLEDGKIPIVELAKICYRKAEYDAILEDGRCYAINNIKAKQYSFMYDISHKGFMAMSLFFSSQNSKKIQAYDDRPGAVFNQTELFQKLYEWHFDVNGLIERDLAIDINTLK